MGTKNRFQLSSVLNKNFVIDLVEHISPFLMFILLFAPDVSYVAPIAMVMILSYRNILRESRILHNSRFWFLGFVLYCLAIVINVNESVSNGLIMLTICFMVVLLSESNQLPATTLYSNTMISLVITHEILLCLFTEFSIGSLLILLVLGILLNYVRLETDSQTMGVLFGCFVGVHAVGWTLSGDPFVNTAFEIDEIVRNWIKFISAPILGVLVFYGTKFTLELFNQVEDKVFEES